MEPEVLSSSLRGGTIPYQGATPWISGKALAVSLDQLDVLPSLRGLRLAVAGAGVFGLCTALSAAAAGAAVELWDPAALADNASGVAAGMIAPAGEAMFDPLSRDHYRLFEAGREGWRALEALAPELVVDRSGGLFAYADEEALNAALGAAVAVGAPLAILTPAEVLAQGPAGAVFSGPTLLARGDWRVDAPAALHALKQALIARGGRLRPVAFSADQISDFDAVVLAAGMESQSFVRLAPELSALSPIKGQILRFDGGPAKGPVIRANGVYLVPRAGGLLAGATMEPGLWDRGADPEVAAELRARAERFMPSLAEHGAQAMAGVRASTADSLPLAGPSSRPNLLLATGARRNGWLLAPLVSQITVSYLSGGDGGPYAAALDPGRFKAQSL